MSAKPIDYGIVEVIGNRIARVGTRSDFGFHNDDHLDDSVHDYGDALIMPGLINLHTHLDYSAMGGLDCRLSLFDWIPALMSAVKCFSPADFKRSAEYGIALMADSGTTTIVDSSFSGQAAVAAAQSGLRAIVGLELFGLLAEEEADRWTAWLQKYEQLQRDYPVVADAIKSGLLQLTVAPHAPYTVSPGLIKRALQWSQSSGKLMLVHVAESSCESRWIADDDETINNFLAGIHNGAASIKSSRRWRGQKRTPVEHLWHHGLLNSSVITAHCVQVNAQDIERLAASGCGVVHCPRSNARLRNGIAPVATMIERGVHLGFGTDSAASNEDLDVLREARFAWNLQRAAQPLSPLSSEDAVCRLTKDAASIIGQSQNLGTLERGKLADLAVFYLPQLHQSAIKNAYDVLLFAETRLLDIYVDGQKVADISV